MENDKTPWESRLESVIKDKKPFIIGVEYFGGPHIGFVSHIPRGVGPITAKHGFTHLAYTVKIDNGLILNTKMGGGDGFEGDYSKPTISHADINDFSLTAGYIFGIEFDDERGMEKAKKRLYEQAVWSLAGEKFEDLTDFADRSHSQPTVSTESASSTVSKT